MTKQRYDFDELRRECAGRWDDIVRALSYDDISEALARKGKHVRCSKGHGKTTYQFRLFPDFDQTGGGICNTCGSYPDGFSLLEHLNGWDRKTAVKEVANYLRGGGITTERRPAPAAPERPRIYEADDKKIAALRQVWMESMDLHGTIGETYFRARGINGELPNTGDVRFHPNLLYWDYENGRELGHYPAIVSLLRSSSSGHPLSIHRIYLDPNGEKANVPEPKKLMSVSIDGAISALGGAIRLYRLEGPFIGVTEGIETATAVRCAYPDLPVWSAYSASVLTNFQVPGGIKGVYVFADLDASGTGQVAAARLALKLDAAGIKVRIVLPKSSVCLPVAERGWYTIDEPKEAIVERLAQDGYQITSESPNIDWLDVWHSEPKLLKRAIPSRLRAVS